MQFADKLNKYMRLASKFSSLPVLDRWSPDPRKELNEEYLEGFFRAQSLAMDGAKYIASNLAEGWTEQQAADLLNTWLSDHGVKSFFHRSYAWFGDRTKFSGINRRLYHQFMPTQRHLCEGDAVILDVAPILKGFTCDIGYTTSLGGNDKVTKALKFLEELRADIPKMFSTAQSGRSIWSEIDEKILGAGYENIHKLYPFSVLGHRIHRTGDKGGNLNLLNFGWHSYWALSSRGIFGQLLNQNFEGHLDGLWAIEPHIGGDDFGAKFEEILIVRDGKASWLSERGIAK